MQSDELHHPPRAHPSQNGSQVNQHKSLVHELMAPLQPQGIKTSVENIDLVAVNRDHRMNKVSPAEELRDTTQLAGKEPPFPWDTLRPPVSETPFFGAGALPRTALQPQPRDVKGCTLRLSRTRNFQPAWLQTRPGRYLHGGRPSGERGYRIRGSPNALSSSSR